MPTARDRVERIWFGQDRRERARLTPERLKHTIESLREYIRSVKVQMARAEERGDTEEARRLAREDLDPALHVLGRFLDERPTPGEEERAIGEELMRKQAEREERERHGHDENTSNIAPLPGEHKPGILRPGESMTPDEQIESKRRKNQAISAAKDDSEFGRVLHSHKIPSRNALVKEMRKVGLKLSASTLKYYLDGINGHGHPSHAPVAVREYLRNRLGWTKWPNEPKEPKRKVH